MDIVSGETRKILVSERDASTVGELIKKKRLKEGTYFCKYETLFRNLNEFKRIVDEKFREVEEEEENSTDFEEKKIAYDLIRENILYLSDENFNGFHIHENENELITLKLLETEDAKCDFYNCPLYEEHPSKICSRK